MSHALFPYFRSALPPPSCSPPSPLSLASFHFNNRSVTSNGRRGAGSPG